MSLTNDQFLLLTKVSSYSEFNRRTDTLAKCMAHYKAEGNGSRWDLNHVPFIGLQLRSLGLVTTYKDTAHYARWDITPVGKAKLLEETQRRAKLAATPAAVDNGKYAVFSESDSGWQQCIGKEAANKLADKWIKEGGEDEVVHVVQIVKSLKVKRVVEEV